MLAFLLQGIGLGFAGGVQPGPFQTFIISKTLENGWRRTLVAALAPLFSDGPIIALVLLVLTRMPPSLQRVMNGASGLFLGYLAFDAFRKWRALRGGGDPPREGESRATLLKAVAMNFISPGPYIYWSLVAGPILLSGWREEPARGVGFILGFYGTLVATFAATIILFGTARRLGPKVTWRLLGISAAALACFSLYQFYLAAGGTG